MPRFIKSTSQRASSSLTNLLQGGIGVPGRPCRMVAVNAGVGLWASEDGVNGGPRPPVRRKPWQDPQSC